MIKHCWLVLIFLSLNAPLMSTRASFLNKPAEHSTLGTQSFSTETTLQNSLEQLKSLSRKEKKSKFKELKDTLKFYRNKKKAGEEISANKILMVLLAIFIPPLAVYLHEGDTNNRFWTSVVLTVVGYILFGLGGILFLGSLPGVIYSLIVILGS